MSNAVLVAGPIDMSAYGKDATTYVWFMNGHRIEVEISNTAMETYEEGDGGRLAEAIRTHGGSEVARMVDWEIPNPHVVLTTADRDDPD